MVDYLIITHLPVFYKVNLYNELAKELKIYVIFLGSDTKEVRSEDFNSLNNANFQFKVIEVQDFQSRNIFFSSVKLLWLIKKIKYKKLLVGGWELPEFWLATFITPKYKNCLSLESSIIESKTHGLRGVIKKIFLSKISTVFASGSLHKELLVKLGFSNKIYLTQGVGLINYYRNKNVPKLDYKNKFIFIGRLIDKKNIVALVELFNHLPSCHLTIVGTGILENKLKVIANDNVAFLGGIRNSQIGDVISQHDMLILPSLCEPWGLVVEEALFNEIPCLVSTSCGCRDLIEDGINGRLFNTNNFNELRDIIISLDKGSYLNMIRGTKLISIIDKDRSQINCYIEGGA